MAASSDVSAFRAAGHSVASTAAHFGISERAVYKSCQAHAARLRRGVVRVASSSSARLAAAGGSVFPDLADDVAHDNTYWRCPVAGELVPVVPGSQRLGWMAERRRLFDRRSIEVTPASSDDEPVVVERELVATPEPLAFMALECDIAVCEPAASAVALPLVTVHNLPRVNVDARGVDWSWLSSWMAEYWRVPLALVVALLLIAVSW
jgi:hypothetical protein